MSNDQTWLPKEPARLGVGVGPLVAVGCDSLLAKTIASVLGRSGRVVRLNEVTNSERATFFRFLGDDGSDLFIKRLPTAQAARQVRADELARSVDLCGVACSTMLDGFPRLLDDSHALCVYSYLEGRHPTAARCDLTAVGTAIAKLQHALARCVDTASVQAEAKSRQFIFEKRIQMIASGVCSHGPEPRAVAAYCAAYCDEFSAAVAQAQMLHGDLNPGNVLIVEDKFVIFLDFEEALSTWASPAIDLALFMERLLLASELDEIVALEAATDFLFSYKEAGGALPAEEGWLMKALRFLTLRSFAVLGEAEASGTRWPDSEWRKFIELAKIHTDRADLIFAIESSIK